MHAKGRRLPGLRIRSARGRAQRPAPTLGGGNTVRPPTDKGRGSVPSRIVAAAATIWRVMGTRATAEGTSRFRDRFPEAATVGHFRRLGGLWVSSIGLGTYLGEPTDAVDEDYEAAILEALAHGCNLFDSSVNYRHQRSERALGRALARAFDEGLAERDEVVVSTKADAGLLGPRDQIAGCHSLAIGYLRDQLARSRDNLGLESIDLYYLHNPETQLVEIDHEEIDSRLEQAFDWLESETRSGVIGSYGVATWEGLRVAPEARQALSLEAMHRLAGAGFAAVQAPINLAMPEALVAPSQWIGDVVVPLAVAARRFGVALVASASILQGHLRSVEGALGERLGVGLTAAQRALQFTRSLPGVTAALVGMSAVEHVRENLALAAMAPTDPQVIQEMFVHR